MRQRPAWPRPGWTMARHAARRWRAARSGSAPGRHWYTGRIRRSTTNVCAGFVRSVSWSPWLLFTPRYMETGNGWHWLRDVMIEKNQREVNGIPKAYQAISPCKDGEL